MKKLVFLIGVAVGFLLGSKAGTGPYEELETKVRTIMGRPEVREIVETTKEAAKEQATEAVVKVSERLPHSDEPGASLSPIPSAV
jgi:hypothetical protein